MDPENQTVEQLTTYLRENQYCLMVDDGGSAIYGEDGKLLVCKAEDRNCIISVPDIDDVRKLYELPMRKEEDSKDQLLDVKVEYVTTEDDESLVEDEVETIIEPGNSKVAMVWLGQRSKNCNEATKALIEIYGRDEFQELMNDNNTIKLKVWEKIALEIETKGFRIANNVRDAGLRTFQKWRNMERTYWKYLNNPDLCGDDKRRKKPSFFDGVHNIISKRNVYRKDEDSKLSVFMPLKMSRIEMRTGAIEVLLRLMDSDKYHTLLQGDSKNILAWECLCSDLEGKGFCIKGDTKREKSENLIRKWQHIRKIFLKYEFEKKIKKDIRKPKYYDLTYKIVSKELIRLKSYEEVDSSMDVGECIQYDHDYDGTFVMEDTDMSTNVSEPSLYSRVNYPPLRTTPISSATEAPSTAPTSTLPNVPTSIPSTAPTSTPSPEPTSTPSTAPTSTHSVQTSDRILLEIKSIHEAALAAQQENFSKIISVLKEQAGHLSTLNGLFTEYVTHRSKKSHSKHNHKNGVIK
uniref:MADF domain-containing protein n=2 Tax=Graphocephala atropunctata TaxID=36148 RepID=A0A1B6L578_9HEMI